MGAEWPAQPVHSSTGLGGVSALVGIGKFYLVFETGVFPVTLDLGVFEPRKGVALLDNVLIIDAQRAVPAAERVCIAGAEVPYTELPELLDAIFRVFREGRNTERALPMRVVA